MAETSVNAFVSVCGRKYLANKSSYIAKQTGFNWWKLNMLRIIFGSYLWTNWWDLCRHFHDKCNFEQRSPVKLWKLSSSDSPWRRHAVSDCSCMYFYSFVRAAAMYRIKPSVCLSVCPSVCPSHACIITKRKKVLLTFLYHTKGQFI